MVVILPPKAKAQWGRPKLSGLLDACEMTVADLPPPPLCEPFLSVLRLTAVEQRQQTCLWLARSNQDHSLNVKTLVPVTASVVKATPEIPEEPGLDKVPGSLCHVQEHRGEGVCRVAGGADETDGL